MRQAGRYMAEYRSLRAKHSMLDLCKTPELAAQVTLQPIERFPLDAAIIFADILLPLEAMGLNLEFAEGEGPVIHNPVREKGDVERLKICRRGHSSGAQSVEWAGAADRIRRCALYFGQLRNRGGRVAQLCRDQADDVWRAADLAQVDG
jgi:hypothetical protein